jgi:hypothetical protein
MNFMKQRGESVVFQLHPVLYSLRMDRRQLRSGTFSCSRKKYVEGDQTVDESKCNPTPRRQ